MRPILIMSSERSGSNLLRSMLGMHPRVASPPPAHLWPHLSRVSPYYGPLSDEANLRRLVADALALTRIPDAFNRWEHALDADEVLERVSAPTLTAVTGAMYAAYAAREGADHWVCKEVRLWEHCFQIRGLFPDAAVVYLCRDGRDVACSIKRVPTHGQHVYAIADEWAAAQRSCLRVHQELAGRGASRLVRYEDLIQEPERLCRELCDFVGLGFDPAMLEFHEHERVRREAQKTQYWSNLSRPVLRTNQGKFREELSRREIRIFEVVAGDVLGMLGYSPVTTTRGRIGRLRRLWYRLSDSLRTLLRRRRLLDEPGRPDRARVLAALYARRRDPPQDFSGRATGSARPVARESGHAGSG